MRQITAKKAEQRRKKQEPLVEPPLTSDGRRNWARMSDNELVKYTQNLVNEKNIPTSTNLFYFDNGLYDALIKRRLLPRLKFPFQRNSWTKKTDEELVAYAQRVIQEEKIKNKRIFRKKEGGLYRHLLQRNLLDSLKFEKGRNWRYFSDAELVAHTKQICRDNGIKTKKQMEGFDKGLYAVLNRRGLINELGFVKPKRKPRDWTEMSDVKLVEYAQSYVDANGLENMHNLQKLDLGLYSALRARHLRSKLRFKKPQRRWRDLNDQELVDYARDFIVSNEVKNRKELWEVDKGLATVLRRRKLLDQVFAPLEQQKQNQALREIAQAVEEFE